MAVIPKLTDYLPTPGQLTSAQQRQMLQAGFEVLECQRVLDRGGLNLVGEVLRGQGEFVEYEHYPRDDVFDATTASQYYYHAHRDGLAEHGHFHTFVRARGRARAIRAARPTEARERWPEGDDAISHLVAISMDDGGHPLGLFTTNRWVTGETWCAAGDVIGWLPEFAIGHANPSWPTNRWVGAMIRLYQPFIAGLLRHRDARIAHWIGEHPGIDPLEDRRLDVLGYLPVRPDELVATLQEQLARQAPADAVPYCVSTDSAVRMELRRQHHDRGRA